MMETTIENLNEIHIALNDKNKTMKTDDEEVCRLCGETSNGCFSIFDNKFSIAEKISRCLPIIVLADDSLPSHICKRCLTHLNICYKLIVTCQKTDVELRKQLEEKILRENERNYRTNSEHSYTLKVKDESAISMRELKRISADGPITCEFCKLIYSDVNNFDYHFETNHILKWKCNFCDASFSSSDELIAHKAITHSGNIIICKSCVEQESSMNKRASFEDSWSSGEEHEDKFFIPADLQSLTNTESTSQAQKSAPIQTAESKSNPPPDVGETSESTSAAITLASTENTLPATFLVTPPLTSKVLPDPTNVTPQIVFTSPGSSPRLVFTPKPNTLNTAEYENDQGYSINSCTPGPSKVDKPVPTTESIPTPTIVSPGGTVKPILTCDICHLSVDDKKLLELHQRIHRPKMMACMLCKQECSTIYDLYQHKKEAHNLYTKVNLKYVCEKCGKFFSNSWQWETHKTRRCKHRDGENKCKYCEASFSTSHKLKRHLRKHKEEMFSDPTVEIFRCISCPKIFVDEEFYQKHRNVHDPACWNKYKCSTCDRSFRDNVRLKEHMKSIHEGVKPHACDVCGKTFHRLSNMKVHRALHFGHKCNHCDMTFEKVRLLINHIQDEHGMEPPASLLNKKGYVSGTHVCRFCGRTLATQQSLLDHEHIHTGEKPYSCQICDKSFRSYTARWSHAQRHEKGNFICEQCGKSFSFKQNLMTHVQIHVSMEERKHECPKCNKKFLRKAHLNVHMRIHNGIRPYKCDVCNFSFTQIGDMRRHRARHDNGEVRKRSPKVKVESVKWISETSNEDTN